jgi:hypothetical protein
MARNRVISRESRCTHNRQVSRDKRSGNAIGVNTQNSRQKLRFLERRVLNAKQDFQVAQIMEDIAEAMLKSTSFLKANIW